MTEQEKQEAKNLFLTSAKVAEKAESLGLSIMSSRSDLLCVLKDAANYFKWNADNMKTFLDADDETFKHDIIGFQKHCPNITGASHDDWDCFLPRFCA